MLKLLLAAIVVTISVCGLLFIYSNKSEVSPNSSAIPVASPNPTSVPNIISIGNGFSTFTADYATISFDFPESWKVEEEFSRADADHEVFHQIEVKDDRGELLLYLSRPHYADGCDGTNTKKEVEMQIGYKKEITKTVCGFQLANYSEFYISIFFVGTKNEQQGRELLKSLR